MHNLQASAYRIHGRVVVKVNGLLANSCVHADVIDKYPGGNRVYVIDPGVDQVFIAEKTNPGPCSEVLVPWNAEVQIPDVTHKAVDIIINEEKKLTVPIMDKDLYNVYVMTGGINPINKCFILPSDVPVLAIYTKVFGPASRAECEKYISENS